jgi:hypothetical protein
MQGRLTALFVLAAAPAVLAVEPSALSIEIQTRQAQSMDGILIELSLTNVSAHPVRLYKGDLPWGVRRSITVTLDSLRTHECVPPPMTEPIDDPGPSIATIQPHETISGTLRLDARFPALKDELSRSDVIAFWSYTVRSVEGVQSERAFGGILLSRITRK